MTRLRKTTSALIIGALTILGTPDVAEGKTKAVDAVRNAAEAHCAGDGCVAWVMRTVAAESCFNPRATHRNRDGSIDQGIAQINNRHRPMRMAVNVWSIDSSIRYMAMAYGRGLASRWYGRSTPKGCGY